MLATATLVIVLVAFFALAMLQILNALAVRSAIKDSERMSIAIAQSLMKEGNNEAAFNVMKAHSEFIQLVAHALKEKK
jgi:Tfp pilus assembly protein PilX